MIYSEWAFHDIEPIYLQLIKKIECAILSTQLSAGEELPSIRVMAKMLKISPNTVMKAYALPTLKTSLCLADYIGRTCLLISR